MKFIHKALCLTALFAIGSVSAREVTSRRAGAVAAAPVTSPSTKPAVPPLPPRPEAPTAPALPPRPGAPMLPARSYKQIHGSILSMRQADVFAGNALKDSFIQSIVAQAKAADINGEGLKFLLQTARDKFAPFSGNNESDLGVLLQINAQIDTAAQNL